MEKILEIRSRWDEIFSETVSKYSIRIAGAICTYLSVYVLLQMAPFREVIDPQINMAVPVLAAVLFFIKTELAIVVFGFLLWVSLSGGMAILMLIACVLSWFVCGSSRINCLIAVITPLCIMNLPESGSMLLSWGLPYFIFIVGVYFACKIDNNAWKYLYPVYFTLLAFQFNLYGTFVKDHFAGVWAAEFYQAPENDLAITYSTFTDYPGDWLQLQELLIPLVLILAFNVLLAYLLNQFMKIKNIKFLNMQLDIREAVIFLGFVISIVIEMVLISFVEGVSADIAYVQIVLQGALAYVVTRPFASHEVANRLRDKKPVENYYVPRNAAVVLDYCHKSNDEELRNILGAYIDHKSYEAIKNADKAPINAVLIYGSEDLDKRLILRHTLEKLKVQAEFFDAAELVKEYREKQTMRIEEALDHKKSFCVSVIDNAHLLMRKTDDSELEKASAYFEELLLKYEENDKTLFFLASPSADRISDTFFEKGKISRILHVSPKDSILLNRTYRLLKPIGKGGAGLVYKAHHERLDVDVVVKKLHGEFAAKTSYKTEAGVLKQLKHTYLPKIYDVFEENKEFYTVMDYIPGESFEDRLKEETYFSQRYVLKWSKQLLEAVEYLHTQETPIIHSDIKPGNVMLTPEGNISLIDFNISLIFDKENKRGIGVSPGYSPIEQYGSLNSYYKILEQKGIRGISFANTDAAQEQQEVASEQSENATVLLGQNVSVQEQQGRLTERQMERIASGGLSERSDIYSIGATLYTLLTGEKPSPDFNAIKPMSAFDLNLSTTFIQVIEKAMEIEPAERFQNVQAMKRALEQVEL